MAKAKAKKETVEARMIPIGQIRIDGGTQPRTEINNQAVDEYEEAWEEGASFPPIEVVYDGKDYWVWDGFHRMHAYKRTRLMQVMANVREGTLADAKWLCLSANLTHGLRRTNADKRAAVEEALKQKADLSDRAIADHCGVSAPFVATVRGELQDQSTVNRLQLDTPRLGRDGRTRDITNIGKKAPEQKPAADPTQPPPVTVEEDAEPGEVPTEAPVYDSVGILLDDRSKMVFLPFLELFKHARRNYMELQRVLDAMTRTEGGRWLAETLQVYQSGGKDSFRSRHLKNLWTDLKTTIPYASVCPYCHHKKPGAFERTCNSCYGTGCVVKMVWDSSPPEQREAVLRYFTEVKK